MVTLHKNDDSIFSYKPVKNQPQITPIEPASAKVRPHKGHKPDNTEQHEKAMAKLENPEIERFKSYIVVSLVKEKKRGWNMILYCYVTCL